jgi:endonuclease YncB( thermonuclease family)
MSRSGSGQSRFRSFGGLRLSRPVDLVVALGILGLLAIAGAVLEYRLGPARSLIGAAQVIDGDSLRLNGEELRLEGLDAPELRQSCTEKGTRRPVACGREARAALAAMLRRGSVTCEIGKVDRYGRGLARCRTGETDINAAMVSQGHAVSYGGYRREQKEAMTAGRGLWALDFDRPEEWRRRNMR